MVGALGGIGPMVIEIPNWAIASTERGAKLQLLGRNVIMTVCVIFGVAITLPGYNAAKALFDCGYGEFLDVCSKNFDEREISSMRIMIQNALRGTLSRGISKI
jgi:hypothetical protein